VTSGAQQAFRPPELQTRACRDDGAGWTEQWLRVRRAGELLSVPEPRLGQPDARIAKAIAPEAGPAPARARPGSAGFFGRGDAVSS
jgi:hypothetical protein